MMEFSVDAAPWCLEYEPDEDGFRLRVTMDNFTLTVYLSHGQAQDFANGVRCWKEQR